MKKFVKVLSVVLVAVMCASMFASCGGSDSYTSKNTTFKIGGTGPLTGDAASYGIAVKNGAQLAVDEINAAGGINGIQLSFDMKDDEADAVKAETGFNALYEDGMQLSIGSVTSGAALSFATAAQENGVIFMTPSASAANVIAVGDKIFRVCFGDPQQGEIAAETLTESYTKIGVVYDSSDSYSTGLYDAFVEKMTALGKAKDTDYVVTTFTSETNKNFSTQVETLKNANCDVVFLPIYYTEAGLIAKEAAKKSFNVPLFGCDGLDSVKNELDSTVTASVSYITPFDINSTETNVKNFVTNYTAKYGADTLNQFAADAYDAVYILANALKEANITDVTADAATIGSAIAKILTNGSFKYTGLTGDDMTWDTTGSCNKAAKIVNVQ